MSTFRVNKNVNYTVMSNHHLQDKRLSLKAKGLLSYMLSLPDDWDYSLKGLTVGCKDGLDSVRTAVLELEEHGYVRRQKVRNAKGQIIDYDYQVYESPVEDAPAVPGKEGGPSDPSATKSPKSRMKPCSSPFLDFPNLAEPNLEKATQQNTNKQNTKRQSTNLSGPAGESADFDQMEAQVREEFRERLEIDTLAQRYDPDKLEEIIKMKENDRRHIPHSLRPVAAVAAALALLGISVGAVNTEPVQEFLYHISTAVQVGVFRQDITTEEGVDLTIYHMPEVSLEDRDGRAILLLDGEETDITDALAQDGHYTFQQQSEGTVLDLTVTGSVQDWTLTCSVHGEGEEGPVYTYTGGGADSSTVTVDRAPPSL